MPLCAFSLARQAVPNVVIQRLYSSGMKLQGTIPLIDRPEAEERASSVVDDLDATIKDLRTAIFSLQARGGHDHPKLRAQITEVVQEMTGSLGMARLLSVRAGAKVPALREHRLLAAAGRAANCDGVRKVGMRSGCVQEVDDHAGASG